MKKITYKFYFTLEKDWILLLNCICQIKISFENGEKTISFNEMAVIVKIHKEIEILEMNENGI